MHTFVFSTNVFAHQQFNILIIFTLIWTGFSPGKLTVPVKYHQLARPQEDSV